MNLSTQPRRLRRALVLVFSMAIVGVLALHGATPSSLRAQTVPDPGGTLPGGTLPSGTLPDGTLPPAAEVDLVYVSSTTGGTVDGITFTDQDILAYSLSSETWRLVFDASDVGITGNDLDGFTVLSNGDLLLSFNVGIVATMLDGLDDYLFASDVVRFVPESLGAQTSGRFERYLDGDDVGLNSAGNGREDIDAVALQTSGRVAVSTKGTFVIPGIRGRDEDLVSFDAAAPSRFGPRKLRRYFDGSDVGLSNWPEDVVGAFVDTAGDIYLTTKGDFRTGDISGSGADVFVCTPRSLGAQTDCAFRLFWRGGEHGFGSEVVDGLALGTAFPPQFDPAPEAAEVAAAGNDIDDAEIDVDFDTTDFFDSELTPAQHAADDLPFGPTDQVYLPLIGQ